jgi:hypothetical protein
MDHARSKAKREWNMAAGFGFVANHDRLVAKRIGMGSGME